MRNSFNPAFHGTIVEEIDYAVLSGSVGVGEGVIAFAISTISFFVFVLGWILVKPDRRPVEAVIRGLNGMKVVSVPWWEPCLFIVGFIAFAVAFFGIGILAQKSKMEDIVNLIESTIMESEK